MRQIDRRQAPTALGGPVGAAVPGAACAGDGGTPGVSTTHAEVQ
ncbi:MAG TPA: hypothetical protein VFO65_09770 [Acidimicrobiales bacterium]|nr:hypothetical protein [Acidimicrobiales bacterium]